MAKSTSENVAIAGKTQPVIPVVSTGDIAAATTNGAPRDKAADFLRLAISRKDKACKAIRQIASLANKSAYTYTDEQRDLLLRRLSDAVEDVAAAFAGRQKDKPTGTL